MTSVPEIIHAENVQGLVLWGYGRLPLATYSLRRIDDPGEFRRWLESRIPSITTADHRRSPTGEAFNIAFTAHALRTLLSERPSLRDRGFSDEFRVGMASRARALGDTGAGACENWEWRDGPAAGEGGGEGRVDVLLAYYWSEPDPIDPNPVVPPQWASAPWDPAHPVREGGMVEVGRSHTETMRTEDGRVKEHFGFTDGLGNPAIRGWSRGAQGPPEKGNEVEPGEFILGYPDQDEVNLFGLDFMRMRGRFDRTDEAHRPVDQFLRDGSYLVARKLEQDVPAFLQFAWSNAGGEFQNPQAHAQEVVTIASKMVGRWPNGAPVSIARYFHDMKGFATTSVRHLDDFDYAADAGGIGCPFGAHVRRVHPRDTVFDHSPQSPAQRRDLVNRRRLLRRGRTYGTNPFEEGTLTALLFPNGVESDPLAGSDFRNRLSDMGSHGRGLFFLGFNADISRQFEHVQRTWINNPFFGGLQEDPDPITGPGPLPPSNAASMTIPTVQGPRRLQKLSRFVTTKAGAYFFMPGIESLRTLAGMNASGSERPTAARSRG
ncbi:MAG: hypothetical protein WEG36_03625 [Gemmatimonadota bacterium]